MAETSSTTIKLAPEMRERIKTLADSKQRSPHWLMKQAIEQYVEREEDEAEFLRETLQSMEDYEATGLHLTHAEVDAWLEKLENGEDAEMPAPHK